ncbi:MAG: TonB-dependent receptor [Sphingomonas sanxanigenens]|uniref:TonB-dependent receptor n=1 Tax=Sphingomonas sanxanigenens TaxID=397260 RepID=A0A2W5AFK1_9SPHN|nr:MAG: TonB-dependent receptor [Sphingomonas sanxanigenens]
MPKHIWLMTAACAALAAPAMAQEAAPQAAAGETDTGADIIVTAQGRAQQLQDVPLAISAVSGEALTNSGATDIRQLNQLAPSLLVSSTGSEANGSARVRGVGTVGDNPGLESSVAVFIDGVYRARTGAGLNDIGDVERVEVQRGPQGTLGGRNASAGLISIVTKKPSFSGLGVTGEATYGNYNFWRLVGSVNAPVSETVAVRVDGLWSKRDGFYKDLVNDTRVNNRDRYFVRGQVLFEPTSDISLRLIGDYTHRNEKCCAAAYVRRADNAEVGSLLDPTKNTIIKTMIDLGQNPAAFTDDPYNRNIYVSSGRSYAGKTTDWGFSGQLDWDFGGAKLTSITAYRNYETNQGSDTDSSQLDLLYREPGKDAYDRRFRTFSQELRLQGSAFDNKLDWLVGGYYSHESLRLVDNLHFGRDYGRFATCRVVSGSSLSALYSPTSAGCLAARPALFGAASPLVWSAFDRLDSVRDVGSINDTYRQRSNNFAFFTHNIFHITDKLDVTLGVRWTKEIKKFNATFNNNNSFCLPQQQALGPLLTNPALAQLAGSLITLTCLGNSSSEINGDTAHDRRSEDQFTGTAIVSWKPIDDLLLYASYARGYKAGGFNLDRSSIKSPLTPMGGQTGLQNLVGSGVLQFGAEKVTSYEVGGKFSIRGFNFNVSAFREEFSNFQLNTFNGSNYIVQNINGCKNLIDGSDADTDTSAATGSCAKGDVTYGVLAQGVELEANVSPVRYVQFNAGLTYASTKYRKDLVGSATGLPLDPALRVLPGKQISNAPRIVTTASFSWTPPIGSTGLSGLLYVDSRLTGDYNTGSDLYPQKAQDGFALVNARIGIRGPDQRWAVEVWTQNIFNKGYMQVAFNSSFQAGAASPNFTSSSQYPGGAQIFSAYLAEPRTYGLTLRGKF